MVSAIYQQELALGIHMSSPPHLLSPLNYFVITALNSSAWYIRPLVFIFKMPVQAISPFLTL